MNYISGLLTTFHERNSFSCGNESLDNYLKKQARQDMKSKVAACFIYTEDSWEVYGYYTLSNGSIPHSQLPESFRKKLPRYKDLPVTLLGRLAVDTKCKGKKLGKLLLLDALKRSFDTSSSIGSMAVIVDPIDQDATNFYNKYGFIALPDSGRMFLPMATIAQLFK